MLKTVIDLTVGGALMFIGARLLFLTVVFWHDTRGYRGSTEYQLMFIGSIVGAVVFYAGLIVFSGVV
jgi:hypothetical protein